MKPIIGITGSKTNATQYSIDIEYVPSSYVAAVQKANAIPLIIPIDRPDAVKDYVDSIDGLLLTGGVDVSPLFYQEEPKIKLGVTLPERDEFEIPLIIETINQKKPILAICRGMQIMNVAYGGTLYQDLSEYENVSVKHSQETDSKRGTHQINIGKNSYLSTLLGEKTLVNSLHHQAISKLAVPFDPVAWSSDGLIEAFESISNDEFILGVQWHPEAMAPISASQQSLFEHFAAVAKNKKSQTMLH